MLRKSYHADTMRRATYQQPRALSARHVYLWARHELKLTPEPLDQAQTMERISMPLWCPPTGVLLLALLAIT
jgi:hypothetical protein